jgi:hypothetical protein
VAGRIRLIKKSVDLMGNEKRFRKIPQTKFCSVVDANVLLLKQRDLFPPTRHAHFPGTKWIDSSPGGTVVWECVLQK